MNQNSPNQLQFNFSGVGCWLTVIAGAWLLGAIGLGWLVKSFFVLVGLILIAPIVLFGVFRWWLQRTIVEGPCPACNFTLTGLKGTESVCPSCGTVVKAAQGQFQRVAAEGSIDVEAVDVEAQQIED
ncbi:MAG: hypothetical protein QNJ46_00100 [Leptolyngbyaceae cyanobacterium MO_188.B28]|nr:hypothetical protein [Leptolyngbyaceae cyanobacterium MO_188.B28]